MRLRIGRLFGRGKDLTCAEVLEVLQAYLDGEIQPEVARAVSKHLDNCADCQVESEVYVRIKVSLAYRSEPVDPLVLDRLAEFGKRLAAEAE